MNLNANVTRLLSRQMHQESKQNLDEIRGNLKVSCESHLRRDSPSVNTLIIIIKSDFLRDRHLGQ